MSDMMRDLFGSTGDGRRYAISSSATVSRKQRPKAFQRMKTKVASRMKTNAAPVNSDLRRYLLSQGVSPYRISQITTWAQAGESQHKGGGGGGGY